MHAAAFDDLAADYDVSFTNTPVGSALRDMVWARFDRVLATSRRVLDLGCGTGEDAMRLAAGGRSVLGIDASADMVRVAQDKARLQGCADRVEFQCLPIEQLNSAVSGAPFDGAVSNFGALNCVRDLPASLGQLACLLQPGARVVCVLMGRYVPWEWAWYLLRGDSNRARRRLGGSASWRGLHINYPKPSEAAAMLRTCFRVDALRPLGFALPPSYAAEWLNRRPRTLRTLALLERTGHSLPWLASFADHYIIEATRLPAGAGAAA